ncbi:putative UPF0481 protein At3g02645 [Cajanus cajan]|uniref:UPF0481 protein At3g47200 family n=1 Tax=Cajanus cajan TaxID=3821 RepID=A0A151RDU6_CAJCA|nr:putative UPF0481 protein At3g02645 [Cajanus cajan]KYP40790.1 UPF0481 protein At3g47200 family [Cajanus cajan]
MACRNLLRFSHHNLNTRKFHATANKLTSNWKHHMKKELESGKPEERNNLICIYKVPSNMRMAERKAYRPNNISIGPYHHGSPHVRNMEALKTNFYRRLFNSNNGAKLDEAFKFLEEQESDIRRCYMEDIKLGKDEFLQMMLIDASFIVQLLRDLSACEFNEVPCLNRWMLPIIRRELIMLENQLPMFVLNKLFELTRVDDATSSQPCMSLKALALRFFYPLLLVDSENFPECDDSDELRLHFLDLLRSSIGLKLEGEKLREVQKYMVRSVTELMEAGVSIKADKTRQLLDITFGKKWGFWRVLTIPPLNINDHRGTAFRNIVAFEKCHKECNPDVTTYLFFFNGLINSSKDVSLLHYKGVLHHSLGSDNAVADLINNITKEIVRDKHESYLHKVANDANSYFKTLYARIRASLVHHYLTSWVAGISTIGALFALYLALLQTAFSFADALEALENNRFGCLVVSALCIRYRRTPIITKADENSNSEDAATN